MTSYGPMYWLDYYYTHPIVGASYYTSCCIQWNCQMHFIVRSQGHLQVRSHVHSRPCSQGRSQLHSITHFQPAWLTLPSKLSRMLPVALDGTFPACLTIRSELHSMALPACLTVRSQVSSQMTPKYTSESLSSPLPIVLDGTLPANLALRSQVHSQVGRHFQSHLTSCSHVSSQSRDLLSCRRQGPGVVRLVAYDGQWLAGGMWHSRVADGRRRMVA